MAHRKDLFDFLLTGIRPVHVVGAIICISALIFLGFLPYWIIRDTGDFAKDEDSWKILYYYSTYIYTLIAFFTLLVIGGTAFAAYQQLKLLRVDVKAASYSQLYSRLDTLNYLMVENVKKLNLYKPKFDEEDFGFSTPERHFVGMVFTLFENVYYQKENFRVLEDSDWNAWELSIKETFDVPYIAEYWWKRGGKEGYTPKFRDEIERICRPD